MSANTEVVFKYFDEITKIPRGSGNMKKISDYCENFAKNLGLKVIRDEVDNIIIFKDGTKDYENSEPVILQGHLDMVCQKEDKVTIDFEKDGLETYIVGDFIKAKGTTLGADNGIAVAMIMSILASDDIPHPPIEAVFTVDEETSMIGAGRIDTSVLKSKKMINIDSEDPKVLTVSCAGGSNVNMSVNFNKKEKDGTLIKIILENLRGGHSGVMIHCGITNANILMGRVLNKVKEICNFNLVSINGGDKGNAIPTSCVAEILCDNADVVTNETEKYLRQIKEELTEEKDFSYKVDVIGNRTISVIDNISTEKILQFLLNVPNGVMAMSKEIENLVETSLNLGIVKTNENNAELLSTLRSNKRESLKQLENRVILMCKDIGINADASGHYPPWEFKENSVLQKLYKETYKDKFGTDVEVLAIHAGLECGMFSDKIDGIDCISIGPLMYDIHTVSERLSISSTKEIFSLICNLLKKLK